MEKHIYFVRHGETDSNADGISPGWSSALTEQGKEQARIVAGRVERIGVSALVSSPFPRALDTARRVSERTGLSVETNEAFGEWNEPSAAHRQHDKHPDVLRLREEIFKNNIDPDYKHSDEESSGELFTRAKAGITFLERFGAFGIKRKRPL